MAITEMHETPLAELRMSDVVTAFSQAADLQMGFAMEHAVGTCYLAQRLAGLPSPSSQPD